MGIFAELFSVVRERLLFQYGKNYWPRRWLDSPLHLVSVFVLAKRALLFRAALLLYPQRFFLGGLRLWTSLSALGQRGCLNCC